MTKREGGRGRDMRKEVGVETQVDGETEKGRDRTQKGYGDFF